MTVSKFYLCTYMECEQCWCAVLCSSRLHHQGQVGHSRSTTPRQSHRRSR